VTRAGDGEVGDAPPVSRMKRLLREPLLHFLLLGTGLFVAYGWLSKPGPGGGPGTIVVSVGRVEYLAAGFAKTRQRPPTDAELKGLIDEWVREEIATREAMALGLDRDDSVIRRRLRQKMDFISTDVAALAEPSEAELDAYLRGHPDAFRVQSRITFVQLYLNPERHGEHLARDAAQLLEKLRQSGPEVDVSAWGDPFLLEYAFTGVPSGDIAKQFGDTFAADLGTLPLGAWQGPVESGLGAHLVRVSERTEGRVPVLGDVRDAVLREWANARRLETNERFYVELLKKYVVIVEPAVPAGEAKVSNGGAR